MTDVAERRTADGVPTRFREAEERGRRLGRGLRRFGHLDGHVDEQLMSRIAVALTERDEPAAALAEAIRRRGGDPGRVSHAQLREALRDGVAPPEAPQPLHDFLAAAAPPAWVDWDLVEQGAALFRRLSTNAADVLLQLSLIGGYRFGGPTELLIATGGLTGKQTLRRLAETQHWATSIDSAESVRPGGEGWRLTLHVRVMHALVNAAYEDRWDIARWGLPVNMADMAGTLGLFDGTVLLGCRGLGVPIPTGDAHAYLHLWRYVGWLMGVHPDFLTDDEHERHRINYHLLLAAPDVTPAGSGLARAAVAAQRTRDYPGWPGPLAAWRGRYEEERLLSMLTVFLGPASMRDLGLPARPPWAFGQRVLVNLWRYRVRGALPGGRERLDRAGRTNRDRVIASYFRGTPPDLASLGAD